MVVSAFQILVIRKPVRQIAIGFCINLPTLPNKEQHERCRACLESSFDVIIHHLYVGLVDTDSAPGQAAGLVDGHILQLRAIVPALLKNQKDFLQQTCQALYKRECLT